MGSDQQFFEGSGIRLYTLGSETKIHAFGIKDEKFRCINGISNEKHTS